MWVDALLSREPLRRDGNNLVFSASGSDDWQRRQAESIDRYENDTYEEDPTIGQMFGNFIATGLPDRNGVILDIGCGLFPEPPHYVSQLGLTRFLGVEPLSVPVNRSYPCLIAMAEDLPLKDGSVDAVLFGTSLDHIGDIDTAIEETKRILSPNGRIFIWQGLSDPDLLAMSSTLHRLRRGVTGVPLIALQAAVIRYRMNRRTKQLSNGERLDRAHERWWTRQQFNVSLVQWGLTVTRELLPPGQTSIFIEATGITRQE